MDACRTGPRDLRMPCIDADTAERFAAWLREQGVDVSGVEGRHVLVPADSTRFVWDIADAAARGYARENETVHAACAFLAERGFG